ncbi:MAG: choice-of-anchor D domain-containing protein [Persicimonas sp.]
MSIPLKRTPLLICALAFAALLAACGGNSFEGADTPALSLSEPATATLALQPPNPPTRTQAQTAIKLRNEGDAEMTITNIEWINRPERLVIRGKAIEDSECDYDPDAANLDASGECQSGSYCSYQTDSCIRLGGEEPPITVPRDQLHVIDTVVMPGENDDIDCPAAPSGRDVPDNYCGELLIETDANNDSGDVEDGNLRIFFTAVDGSGEIALDPTNLTFSGVERAQSASRDLTITNDHAEEALDITDMRFREHRQLFNVEGDSLPTEIRAGASKTWSVDFTAPDTDEWESDEEALGTELEITSSARNGTVTNLPITVSKQSSLPAIVIEPNVLHFHEDTQQRFTVSNRGDAPLTMQSLSLDPSTLSNVYEFSIDDETFESSIPSGHKVIRPDESVDIDVNFAGAGQDGTIATFDIVYNYYVDSDRYTEEAGGLLLGDSGDAPVGFAHPDAFTFSADDGHSASRQLVVRNVGTQPLEIDNATFRANAGSADNFSVSGAEGTIEAGDLKLMTLDYEGDGEMDNVLLEFNSNDAGSGFDLFLTSDPNESPSEIEAQITPGFGDDSTSVGAEAGFSARQSTNVDEDNLERAQWVLLDRPDGSEVFFDKKGADISFVPDVAGTYEVSVLVHNGSGVGAQATYSFDAVE